MLVVDLTLDGLIGAVITDGPVLIFMSKHEELIGKVFGRLTVIALAGMNKKYQALVLCKCECGNEIIARADSLKDGNTKSCGCLRSEVVKVSKRIHGQAGRGSMTKEYKAWEEMKKRCTNPKRKYYPDYGGRGIRVYPPWVESFQAFYDYVGQAPSPEHSLDRWPNNETGHYEPGNVRWGTDEQQSRNKRNNVWLEHDGKRMVVTDWARLFNLKNVSVLCGYLKKHTFEEAYEHYKHRIG